MRPSTLLDSIICQWHRHSCLCGLFAPSNVTRTSCYTNFVLKNVTITLSEEALRWARRKAAEENTSVSKLVGRMLENQMRQTDEYWQAYEKWKKLKPIKGVRAAERLTREEAHARR